jgi:hypothetical protein
MTVFFRLLQEKDKASALTTACANLRAADTNDRVFAVDPHSFRAIPGSPFAYWVSEEVRRVFGLFPSFDGDKQIARITNPFGDNNRFLRAWWEVDNLSARSFQWVALSKGGAFSPFYYDVHLVTCWNVERQTYHGFVGTEHRPLEKPACVEHFFRPGLTWPSRANGLSFRILPKGCIFAGKGPAAFAAGDNHASLLSLCALTNSRAFETLVSLQLARTELAQSFEVGLIQQTPIPDMDENDLKLLRDLARRAWSLKRSLDTIEETSHAFLLPAALRARLSNYDPSVIETELARIQVEIDDLAFGLYGFSDADRTAAEASHAPASTDEVEASTADDTEDADLGFAPVDNADGMLSWAVGVAFGRFDWRLATGERDAPPEPDPFDPLPAKSPGMMPDGAPAFHAHHGILVDDQGHPHDLPRLIEAVLARVGVEAPGDLRRWLHRDFFPLHLKQYSKSRRKAPIYWSLSTASGAYTLWLHYPSLTDQTLHAAVNDFIEPKLKQLAREATALRDKGAARTRDDDKALGAFQDLERELNELREALLRIAPTWKPNHDDGVQITAAPLYELFRHKPWQTVLKDTWAKLSKGDYDWAHLAMAYWPTRVREKCKTDKSLAIAHDLEALYVAPEPKAGGRKKNGAEA